MGASESSPSAPFMTKKKDGCDVAPACFAYITEPALAMQHNAVLY